MSENTQPESAAKVEEIAQQIAEAGFHRDCGNHSPRVIESELEDIESILRPYIPSQPPALDVSRILRLMEWLLDVFPENVANEVGTKDNDNFHECGDLVRELRELAAPPTKIEDMKYLKLLRWFKLFYKFYQDVVKDKPSACASALAEDGELQEFIREANRIG